MKGNFQIIILIIFIAAAIFGVLVFSGAIPLGSGGEGSLGTVVLWGTIPAQAIAAPLEDFNNANPTFTVNYVQKSVDTFDRDLLEALASGKGPDMFFLPDNLAFSYANKIFTIPYGSYPLSTFKNVFAGAGEVFLTGKGILAFPMSIDPVLTKKDDSNRILKSAVALGHFSNIVHAKDILVALFMQAGNPIIKEENGVFISTLNRPIGNYNLPSILKFYTDFADPNNPAYSWNRSFSGSGDAFSKEDLAFYFGYAGEFRSLVNKNPNQNFFIAEMPQIKNSNFKLTGARVTGLAISSFSKNFNTAFTAASLMATGDFAHKFATATGVASAAPGLFANV